jgi:hypothetical protein
MSDTELLIKEVKNLPEKYIHEVRDFISRLNAATSVKPPVHGSPPDFPERKQGRAESSTPLTDRLSGVLSHARDISPQEIREERLNKYL